MDKSEICIIIKEYARKTHEWCEQFDTDVSKHRGDGHTSAYAIHQLITRMSVLAEELIKLEKQ